MAKPENTDLVTKCFLFSLATTCFNFPERKVTLHGHCLLLRLTIIQGILVILVGGEEMIEEAHLKLVFVLYYHQDQSIM